jgi:hypothetical protein
MRRSTEPALVTLLVLLSGCRTAQIEPFGETQLAALCADAKRCDAHGDSVVNLLKQKQPRLYLIPDKGPEQLLGKVAPGRKVDSVMKTCGAEIAAQDWLQSPDALRELSLGKAGKRALSARLHAYLSSRVAALSLGSEQGAESSIRDVVQAVALEQVSWVSQAYWLTDSAFERRVAQCGEEERANIIYSMTVLSPSASFQRDLVARLRAALEKKLGAPAQPVTDDAGSEDAGAAPAPNTYDTLARDVVRAFARDTRVVAALGFDDP